MSSPGMVRVWLFTKFSDEKKGGKEVFKKTPWKKYLAEGWRMLIAVITGLLVRVIHERLLK
jgi:hypothetical protein